MKNTEKFEEIVLQGIKVHIYENKVQFFNKENVEIEEFKSKANRLTQYLIDEAFIEKKSKIRVEVVQPE